MNNLLYHKTLHLRTDYTHEKKNYYDKEDSKTMTFADENQQAEPQKRCKSNPKTPIEVDIDHAIIVD